LLSWSIEQRIDFDLLSQGEAFNRKLAQSHYENFAVAARILPRQISQDLYNIYAFCRLADDFADNALSKTEACEKLSRWGDLLEATVSDELKDPLFRALADTIHRHNLSLDPFRRLLQAFQLDLVKHRYSTRSELSEYTHLSADPVGTIVLELYGYHDPAYFALSDRICTALQLANHWQDVAEDFDRGRIYIPEEDMLRHNVSERNIADRDANSRFKLLMQDEVNYTRRLFCEGRELLKLVRGWLRLQLGLYFEGGMAALSAIERNDYDVLNRSSKLRSMDKMGVIFKSCLYLFAK